MSARVASRLARWIGFPLEAAAALLAYGLFRALPLDAASALGARMGRLVGPRMGAHGVARRNLERAFPEKSPAEIAAILRAMWDNLGRVLGEWSHVSDMDIHGDAARFTVTGVEWIDLLRDDGRPGVFFSAHLGNWEIAALGASQRGVPVGLVYRAANNPLVEHLYRRARRSIAGIPIPKGPEGARRLLRLIRKGGHVALLADQKMNDGVPVPFFGRVAMTAPALVDIALRFDCPVVPARVIRTRGAHFRIEVHPPMTMVNTGDRHADIATNLGQVNALLESWIREHPEQWLWAHRRWPD